MATLTKEQLEARRDELMRNFDAYRDQVSQGLTEAAQALEREEYAHACAIMSTISAHQAQASINLRAVLVKNGMIAREREE